MFTNGVEVVFGGATFLSGPIEERIDTAERYSASEELLGIAGAASRFIIDTKYSGPVTRDPSTKDRVLSHAKKSLRKLNTDSVDIYYLHAPDRGTPIKETLSALSELHQQGAFQRLGLSNFLAEEVEETVRVANENNFVLPSVYQGNYNAVARRADTELLPVLRKNKIAFYAYSPIAGGFLAKSKAGLFDPQGRFSKDFPLSGAFRALYDRPSFVAALDDWEKIAEDEGVSRSELAYRWVVYHSKLQKDTGDAVIIGARNVQQFRETIGYIQAGPLSDASAKKIDDIWESVKADAALDMFNNQ